MFRKEKNERDNKVADKKLQGSRQISFQSILIEFLSILLGVLLALGMNEWREDRSHQKQAATALLNIKAEIQANFGALKSIHENNLKTMASMNNAETSDSSRNLKFIPGLQLRETAWKTFLSTGISNYVNYEKVLFLSQTYSIQEIYKDTGKMITQSAMHTSAVAAANGRSVDDVEFAKHFQEYLQMMVDVEATILEAYQSSLEKLN